MARHLARRILYGIITVFAVILLTFVVQYLLPGDPARSIAGPKASPEVLAQVRRTLHLDDSFFTQLWHYLGSVLTGNLGTSYMQKESVLHLIMQRLPATALLAGAALVIEVIIGSLWGFWEATRSKRSWLLASVNVSLLSMPAFSLGFILLLLFGYVVPIFPIDGGTGAAHLVLPALTLGLLGAPYYANVVRDGVRESLTSSYVRTAVAKGLPRRTILTKHVLRNAAPPVATMLGMDVAIFLSGVVFVEKIFAWPGIGQLQTQAFANVDRPLLIGTVIVASTLVVAANIVVDVVRSFIDPRAAMDAA